MSPPPDAPPTCPASGAFQPPRPVRSAGEIKLSQVWAARNSMLGLFSEREFRTHRRGMVVPVLKRRVFAINEARGVRHTLREQHTAFNRKSPQMRRALIPLLGDGLFVSEGALWAERRAAVAPIVHTRNVPTFAPTMCAVAREYLAEWHAAGAGHTRDMLFEMGELTAEIIARTIFGSALGRAKTQQIIGAFADY